jgi:hypothetical protein
MYNWHLLAPNPDEVVAVLNPNPGVGAENGLANRFAPEFELANPPNPAVEVACAPNAGLFAKSPP